MPDSPTLSDSDSSRKSAGWRTIPASDYWVCPACLMGTDPDTWQIEHEVVHWSAARNYQRTLCSLWCPSCGACFGSGSGAAEIARLTEARIAARRRHAALRLRIPAAWRLHWSGRTAEPQSSQAPSRR